MTSRDDKLAHLHEALIGAADARAVMSSPIWDESWARFEAELLERLLKCGPDEDSARYRLQIGIQAARSARRAFEHEGKKVELLEREIAGLEGRIMAPVA